MQNLDNMGVAGSAVAPQRPVLGLAFSSRPRIDSGTMVGLSKIAHYPVDNDRWYSLSQ